MRTFDLNYQQWNLPSLAPGVPELQLGDRVSRRDDDLTCIVTFISDEHATGVVTVELKPNDEWQLTIKRSITARIKPDAN